MRHRDICQKSDEIAQCYVSQVDNGKRRETIRTSRYIISFAIDIMGAAGDACVGDGLLGKGGRAMRLSISEMDGADKMRDCDQAR